MPWSKFQALLKEVSLLLGRAMASVTGDHWGTIASLGVNDDPGVAE